MIEVSHRKGSSYIHRKDKWRIHAPGNHLIFASTKQRIIGAEMIAYGLAVDDRPRAIRERRQGSDTENRLGARAQAFLNSSSAAST